MSIFTADDSACMARALRLAERGRYTAHPNPMVGCVIARDGHIVGEGWHAIAGESHAEVNALAAAGDNARGAVAYVTLEPCVHHGKTPPCVDALIEAGVGEVVAAMPDPFPEVGGRGLDKLERAGIEVRVGLMADAAEKINAGFLSRVRRGRPRVQLKVATSLDGAIAMQNGDSQWITGQEARADVQRLRGAAGAVLTGIGTVTADDPSLNVRDAAVDTNGRQPVRVVLDSTLRMPVAARMLSLPGTTLLYCTEDGRRADLESAGAEVMVVAGDGERVSVDAVLGDLARREINDVLVEAGPRLCGSLLEQGQVDELVIYQAPHIMGSNTMRMFETPAWLALDDRLALEIVDARRIGNDTRITALPRK